MIQQYKKIDLTSNPGPLGLFGFALTTILLNIHNAGFYGISVMIMSMGIFFGGFAQLLAGIMEWKRGNQFGSIAFISYGSFWLTLVFIWIAPIFGLPKATNLEMGFYLFAWGLFTLVFFIQTFNGKTVGKILFGLLTLLFFLLAVGNFIQSDFILRIAGFEGVLCGLVAFYEASAIMINEKYKRNILPM
ncbi:acetate uptake transporter [Sphingobacterium bovistauri]|uniref:Acetate uptake transporter n=1 Tax=Sphingobacterium bovistauri TaxID=2781959 RepID=A0ABS7Z9K8_9SPHI|nr:acetate uptake transporter [Sphingobacterium bovistauri]MCA5006693.1 acetate uptake transporter [Sphingobacterium bovistauri]